MRCMNLLALLSLATLLVFPACGRKLDETTVSEEKEQAGKAKTFPPQDNLFEFPVKIYNRILRVLETSVEDAPHLPQENFESFLGFASGGADFHLDIFRFRYDWKDLLRNKTLPQEAALLMRQVRVYEKGLKKIGLAPVVSRTRSSSPRPRCRGRRPRRSALPGSGRGSAGCGPGTARRSS